MKELHRYRTGPALMPPEATRTLHDKVHRREIGEDRIEIHVERLLHHLRGNEDAAGADCFSALPAEVSNDVVLDNLAIALGEAGVE